MSATDIIWTTLEILMVVCVYLDLGATVFSGIQIFGLFEAFLYIAHPEWTFWSRSFYMINLPVELVGVACTKRYMVPRIIMGLHIVVKMVVYFHLEIHLHMKQHSLLQIAGDINQTIILALLAVSARSLFTQRSQNAKSQTEAPRKQPRRSPYSTATTTSFHQPAFVRGLY